MIAVVTSSLLPQVQNSNRPAFFCWPVPLLSFGSVSCVLCVLCVQWNECLTLYRNPNLLLSSHHNTHNTMSSHIHPRPSHPHFNSSIPRSWTIQVSIHLFIRATNTQNLRHTCGEYWGDNIEIVHNISRRPPRRRSMTTPSVLLEFLDGIQITTPHFSPRLDSHGGGLNSV